MSDLGQIIGRHIADAECPGTTAEKLFDRYMGEPLGDKRDGQSKVQTSEVFDTVEALTRGGPSKSTYVMVYAMFEKGIQQNLVGIGSTLTVVFLVFVLALTLMQVYFVNRRVHYS